MGKSTTASMFRKLGVPVFDADAAVHRLYEPGGAAVPVVQGMFPGAVVGGAVDRQELADLVLSDKSALARLEAAVHPLVREQQEAFLRQAAGNGAPIVILDIPLLFETGRQNDFDVTVLVTAPDDVRRRRIVESRGLSDEEAHRIMAAQMPRDQRLAGADHVLDNSGDLGRLQQQVEALHRLLLEQTGATANSGDSKS